MRMLAKGVFPGRIAKRGRLSAKAAAAEHMRQKRKVTHASTVPKGGTLQSLDLPPAKRVLVVTSRRPAVWRPAKRVVLGT